MHQRIQAVISLTLLATSLTAHAVTIESSTAVYLTLRECVAGETPCDSITPSINTIIDGLPGNNESEAAHEDPEFGKVSGSAKLAGRAGGSEHSARSSSVAGARNGSTVGMLQKYTNEGSSAQVLSYSGTLSFEQSVPEENASIPEGSPGRSFALAMLGAVRMNLDAIEAGTTVEENWVVVSEGPGEEVETTDLGMDRGASPPVSGTGGIDVAVSFTVEPGESVWLWAMTQVLAANGAEVSADFVTRLEEQVVALGLGSAE